MMQYVHNKIWSAYETRTLQLLETLNTINNLITSHQRHKAHKNTHHMRKCNLYIMITHLQNIPR